MLCSFTLYSNILEMMSGGKRKLAPEREGLSQDCLKTPDEERAPIYVLPPKCEQRHHPAAHIHRKKRFTSFPSPAGMSLTKLPLGRNNLVMTSLFPPRESLVVTSRLGTGNLRNFFYGVCTVWAAVAASTSEILACELCPLHDLPAAQSEGARCARKGKADPTLFDKQCGPLALKAMCQGVVAGKALVRLPDDNQCEVQVGLAGGPVHHQAPNAVQPRVATVSHFERVSPSPGSEVHKCSRERIKAGRSGQHSCSSWMLSRALRSGQAVR